MAAEPTPKTVTVLLFGAVREAAGADRLEAPAGGTVSELRAHLSSHHAAVAPYLPSCRIAIDAAYAADGDPVPAGAEVAVIPPVSGGREEAGRLVRLQPGPIDVAALHEWLADPACGGRTVFTGVVRDHHEGRAVDHLEYEAYEPMAERELAAILDAALARHGLGRAAVVHRTGRLEIGEVAVAVAVAAPHRGETFAAVAEIMQRIKADVPIFKRETYADGSHAWVRCRHVNDSAPGPGGHPFEQDQP